MSTSLSDWIVLIPDFADALPKRLKARSEHIDGLKPRIDFKIWVMGGATLSTPAVDGQDKQYNGSCIVARASSKEEVLAEIKTDIFAREGIWDLEKIQIFPLVTAFRNQL